MASDLFRRPPGSPAANRLASPGAAGQFPSLVDMSGRIAGHRRNRIAGILALGLWAGCSALGAGPYTPRSDDEILERVPVGTVAGEARKQRRELAEDAENLRDSVELARSYLATARAEGDARFEGYAKAVLGPWWDQASPPSPVRVLRGRIRAATWDDARALEDFRAVLLQDPKDAEAVRRAFELHVERGDLDEARALLPQWPGGPTSLAVARAGAWLGRIDGRAGESYVRLKRTLEDAGSGVGEAAAEERHEALVLLADLAWQLGDRASARAHFAALAAEGRRDVARLGAQADFLLEEGRFDEVIALLKDEAGTDALLVRLGEAWIGSAANGTEETDRRRTWMNQLEKRLEARRRRDDPTALPDEIRFRLRVRPDVAAAGARARELWGRRRSLEQVRWILAAATAAGDRELSTQVMDWVRSRKLEDARGIGMSVGKGAAGRAAR